MKDRPEAKRLRQNRWVKRLRKEIELEISIEKRCGKLLDAVDIEHEKYGQHGDPDRLIFLGHSHHIWFEFKRTKFGSLTKLQRRRFRRMLERGEVIYIIKNANAGLEVARLWQLNRVGGMSDVPNAERLSLSKLPR